MLWKIWFELNIFVLQSLLFSTELTILSQRMKLIVRWQFHLWRAWKIIWSVKQPEKENESTQLYLDVHLWEKSICY